MLSKEQKQQNRLQKLAAQFRQMEMELKANGIDVNDLQKELGIQVDEFVVDIHTKATVRMHRQVVNAYEVFWGSHELGWIDHGGVNYKIAMRGCKQTKAVYETIENAVTALVEHFIFRGSMTLDTPPSGVKELGDICSE